MSTAVDKKVKQVKKVRKKGAAAPPAEKRPRKVKPVAGWLEHIDLPELKVHGLRAKLDTGARSSALHVDGLRFLSPKRVAFDVVLDDDRVRHVKARVARISRVKSSNGQFDERVFIQTLLRIGPHEREIEVSLVDRENMLHRMLLGRTSLKGLVVDPSRRHLLDDD